MKVLIAHLYAKLWARNRQCKYRKIGGIAKGIMELPNGARFSFTLVHNGKLDLRGLGNQLRYQSDHAAKLSPAELHDLKALREQVNK